ncbi:unnamed protein product [Caenorhabditis auriculariae]|uniref:Uncharacterized protein n=1 Tax=Caenorhabditis auriculariae TaxID=2777116 RepID=A0A8S1HKK5_9PELO|nr:unnamed protein product [Caenorhabditis auriculariae]
MVVGLGEGRPVSLLTYTYSFFSLMLMFMIACLLCYCCLRMRQPVEPAPMARHRVVHQPVVVATPVYYVEPVVVI